MTVGQLLDEVTSVGACGTTRRALTVGTQSYRRILNAVRDWDLGGKQNPRSDPFRRRRL